MNLHFIDKKEIFPIVLILILALSRLLPHPPNFTPIITIGIMSSYFFKNIFSSLIILLISMLLSDLFIGFYQNMVFVYLSLILITCIFFKIIKKANYSSLLIYSFFGSLSPILATVPQSFGPFCVVAAEDLHRRKCLRFRKN